MAGLADVVGHERLKRLLARAIRQRRLPHALLLAGPEGVGKRALGLVAVRALLCERRDGDACDQCAACRRVLRGLGSLPELRARAEKEGEPELFNYRLHPDVLLIEPSPREIRIDQVRLLVQELARRSFDSGARAVLLDDAHLLRTEAANALLKSLEEPPPGTHLFLITASPEALLPTIRSRCQTLRFGGLPTALLIDHLRQRAGLDADEARLRAALAGGSLGAALQFESDEYRERRDELLGLLESRLVSDQGARLALAERLADWDDPAGALTTLRSLLRDVAALRSGAQPGAVLNADAGERLSELAQAPLGQRAIAVADAAGWTRQALRGNANPLLALDRLVAGFAGPPP